MLLTVRPGGKTEREFTIRNRSTVTVAVASVGTTCNCLTVFTPTSPLILAPGLDASLRVAVNLAQDPGFVGEFAPEARLLDVDGVVAGLLTLDVVVRP